MPGQLKATYTIFFIDKSDIPAYFWKDVTYWHIVVSYRPEKADPNCTRLTVDGNRVNYTGGCGAPTTDLLTVKILLNITISTPGAWLMTIDIKDFYPMTPMGWYEYMQLKQDNLPEDVIQKYTLQDKVNKDGYVYLEISQGMYWLPQAGILAQKQLEEMLNIKVYKQSWLTPRFWTHATCSISFTLSLDAFGVKYEGKKYVQHLVPVLKEHCTISHDCKGKRYLSINMDWGYARCKVHLSMLLFVKETLIIFNHSMPWRPQDQPQSHIKPKSWKTCNI